MRDRQVKGAAGTRLDVRNREVPLGLARARERLLVRRRAEDVARQHLVDMEVRVDEARRDEAAARVDGAGRGSVDPIGDALDAAVPDGDVVQPVAIEDARLRDDEGP